VIEGDGGDSARRFIHLRAGPTPRPWWPALLRLRYLAATPAALLVRLPQSSEPWSAIPVHRRSFWIPLRLPSMFTVTHSLPARSVVSPLPAITRFFLSVLLLLLAQLDAGSRPAPNVSSTTKRANPHSVQEAWPAGFASLISSGIQH